MRPDFYARYFELEDRHWWFLGRRAIILRLLDRELSPRPGDVRSVLDVGCGSGAMLPHLARYGRVEGVDADKHAVDLSRERGITAVRHVQGLPLPFDDGSFDVVTALDVLEHIDDDAGMLRELVRVLRPGGTLLATVPAFRFLWGPQDEISEHKRRYLRSELLGRLQAAQLQVRRLSYFNTVLFPVIAAIRLLRPKRRGSRPLRSDFELGRSLAPNRLLARIFGLEARLVERYDLPFGVSLIALATKPLGR